ncbi:MAG: hypothetical protein LQ347_004846 [Umbilicaria vellea]|nr:MAG: hypothetical protein LQ347_004846 [Umbilicaria vellea]
MVILIQAIVIDEVRSVDIEEGATRAPISNNQGPNQAQNNLPVPIHHVLGPNIRHLNAPPLDKIQRLIHILEPLHPQLRFRGVAAEGLVAEDFEQVDQYHLRGARRSDGHAA